MKVCVTLLPETPQEHALAAQLRASTLSQNAAANPYTFNLSNATFAAWNNPTSMPAAANTPNVTQLPVEHVVPCPPPPSSYTTPVAANAATAQLAAQPLCQTGGLGAGMVTET
ncbi:MAG: hypothetical protein EOO40_12735, partial [Deltaproteobacteria bacterium]